MTWRTMGSPFSLASNFSSRDAVQFDVPFAFRILVRIGIAVPLYLTD